MALSRKYGQIRKEYNPDAILNGAITCADIFADGYAFFMCKPVFLRKNDMAFIKALIGEIRLGLFCKELILKRYKEQSESSRSE